MNRYATYLAGGALLATTALASGTVSAATVTTGVVGGGLTATTNTPVAIVASKISNVFFTGAASNASAVATGSLSFSISSSTNYNANSADVIVGITGAEFVTTAAPTITAASVVTGSLTLASTITANVTVFSDKIIVGGANGVSQAFNVINFQSASVKNMQSLATVGSSVSLTGSIQNPALTFTFENITTAAAITSTGTPLLKITAGSTVTASSTATPAYSTFTNGTKSATMGTVRLSIGAGENSTDLVTPVTAAQVLSTTELKLTHPSLTDPAFVSATLLTGGTVFATVLNTTTQIVSGAATFTLQAATLAGTPVSIAFDFNGTSSIKAGSGTGTIVATPKANTGIGGVATVTGNLASITLGGLSTQVNTFQNSSATIGSFLRVSNNGGNSGTFSIVVANGLTGTLLGTYNSTSSTDLTSGVLQANGTVQLSAANIEAGAGITASTTNPNYTLTLTATFNGYVQHLGFTPSSGALSNLSAFRQGGSVAGTTQNAP